jgi:dTMP kinase
MLAMAIRSCTRAPERREAGARASAGATVSERGMYVVVEGIDGTGKTELAARLVPPLLRRGHSVSSFREPSDRFLRTQFTRLLKSDSLAAALCYSVDRAMQRPEIESALEQGDIVVQDRSFYSSFAYHAPGLDTEAARELERIDRTLAIEPDIVLYLDASVDVAIRRVEASGQRNAFEDEPYLRRVKAKFEQMFQPPRWVRIDASGTPEHTIEQAMNALLAAGL